MIRNNDVKNTEDNGNKPQTDEIKDVTVPNEKFLFREPIVLISIVSMSLVNGLSFYQRSKILTGMPLNLYYALNSLSSSTVPVVGLIFAAFLSEVTGRKHVYRYLFAISILSSFILVLSNHPTVMCLILILQGMIRGGSSVMNAVAISEYSSPKHRFAWMIFDKAAINTISRLVSTITESETLFYTLLVIQIVLGLICLGSTWAWPESPYWLANRGNLEHSRAAFMWLRGKEGREELASVLKARRRPGPPKLFWISLLIAIATILVSTFSHLQKVLSAIFCPQSTTETPESQVYIHFFCTTAITCTLAVLSYFIRRKVIFIVVSIISFILCYAEALLYLIAGSATDGMLFYLLHIACDVIQSSGPAVFGVILFIEITPHKYNTFISCICFIVMFSAISILLPLTMYVVHGGLEYIAASLALFTTLALVAALLYCFFAPETKDKTLLEIQRSYTPDENDSNPEQNQSIILNVI